MNPPTISTDGPVDGLVFEIPSDRRAGRVAGSVAGFSAFAVVQKATETKKAVTKLQAKIFVREILIKTKTSLELGGSLGCQRFV